VYKRERALQKKRKETLRVVAADGAGRQVVASPNERVATSQFHFALSTFHFPLSTLHSFSSPQHCTKPPDTPGSTSPFVRCDTTVQLSIHDQIAYRHRRLARFPLVTFLPSHSARLIALWNPSQMSNDISCRYR